LSLSLRLTSLFLLIYLVFFCASKMSFSGAIRSLGPYFMMRGPFFLFNFVFLSDFLCHPTPVSC
jgi:hypothetical protein